ncbi:MAG: branched-chain amino acid ABC transporter permease [Ancalomicrobiaceae bacterium]|nr:branched-chain amino acid ABC transporter permease [Ancalomicrobiaceae bacterium]
MTPTGASPIAVSALDARSITRWTLASRIAVAVALPLVVAIAFGPAYLSANVIDKLTTLFIYILLAVTWNALAGYGGLISIGQQGFFGLGAYATVRLADAGLTPYPALFVGAGLIALFAYLISFPMLRLRNGELGIGLWVLAELMHLIVNLDSLVQGETGTSLIALNAFSIEARRAYTYWAALGAVAGLIILLFILLRGPVGTAIQAIRDNEEAAASVGVRVKSTRRLIFVVASLGAALAGALWLASATTFQPKAYFGVQWTAYMIFMVLVGGLGTFEGAIVGAVIFFLIEAWFGAFGVWYLIGLGTTALVFALFVPKGLWGLISSKFDLQLLPLGYRVALPSLGRSNR